MAFLVHLMIVLAFAPLVLLPGVIVLALLMGGINPAGVWRDSFDPVSHSPARVFQFIAALASVAAVLIGLGESGWTAFAPLPSWLAAAAGGGNFVYLAAKWNSRPANGRLQGKRPR